MDSLKITTYTVTFHLTEAIEMNISSEHSLDEVVRLAKVAIDQGKGYKKDFPKYKLISIKANYFGK